ncbi:hypothetical protein ACQKWADRAFT_306997 [Trichoderma austrokoningii]
MAPLICRVVDIFDIGVKGVHVLLECRDEFYNCVARMDAMTGDDGWIYAWLPMIHPLDDGIKPQIVDTTDMPRVSLAFIPHSHPTAPWLSIRADLYLSGVACHGVVLHLEESPRLEYLAQSSKERAGVAPQSQDRQTPSPFLLPSPMFTPALGYEATEDQSDVTKKIPAEKLTDSRKRKFELGSEKGERVTRQRLV